MRLEQGRESLPSKATVEKLAEALRLGATEHAHRLRLALGTTGRVFKRETVPDHLTTLIQEILPPPTLSAPAGTCFAGMTPQSSCFAISHRFPSRDGTRCYSSSPPLKCGVATRNGSRRRAPLRRVSVSLTIFGRILQSSMHLLMNSGPQVLSSHARGEPTKFVPSRRVTRL